MSELKVNSIKGTGASTAAITIDSSSGGCSANITNNLSNKNLIINGAMLVAQRGTSSTSNNYATVDRFQIQYSGTDEAPTQAQADVASGTTPYTLGFRKSFKITNGNQSSGAGAGDYIMVTHNAEAQNIANSGWNYTSSSSYITLSFWVKSSVSQDFKGYLRTVDGTSQIYPYSTGTLSANTWTKITKTISGNSNLQFDNNNEAGLQLYLWPYIGTTYTDAGVTENAWASYASGTRTPVSATTWYTTNDATFEITGVQLEVGSVATDFEHRSFNSELDLCQRYYNKSYAYGTTAGTATTSGALVESLFGAQNYASISGGVRFTKSMRTTPTITLYSTANANTTGKMSADSTDKTTSVAYQTENGFFPFVANSSSGLSQNVFLRCQYEANAEL